MKRRGAKYLTLVSRAASKDQICSYLGEIAMTSSARKPDFWVRTAGGPSIGFGHLRRSVTLARLLNDFVHPLFLHDSNDPWTEREASSQGWGTMVMDRGVTWSSVPRPSGLLVDTREEQGLHCLIAQARERSVPVVSVHDLGLNPLPSDVVIDGSIFPAVQDFPRRDTSFYTGTAYLVLDPAFGLIHQQRKRIRQGIQTVVISLGGGDSSRFFEKILQGLKTWGHELDVVGLRGFSEWGQEQLAQQDWSPVRFRWALKGECLERLLFRADVAVTAGGLAAFEALCAGTPLLSLSYDGYQSFTLSMLAKADACIDLGQGDHLKPASIPSILAALDENPAVRERMSFNGRQIVDGRGAERVSRLIRRLVDAGAFEAQPMVV